MVSISHGVETWISDNQVGKVQWSVWHRRGHHEESHQSGYWYVWSYLVPQNHQRWQGSIVGDVIFGKKGIEFLTGGVFDIMFGTNGWKTLWLFQHGNFGRGSPHGIPCRFTTFVFIRSNLYFGFHFHDRHGGMQTVWRRSRSFDATAWVDQQMENVSIPCWSWHWHRHHAFPNPTLRIHSRRFIQKRVPKSVQHPFAWWFAHWQSSQDHSFIQQSNGNDFRLK